MVVFNSYQNFQSVPKKMNETINSVILSVRDADQKLIDGKIKEAKDAYLWAADALANLAIEKNLTAYDRNCINYSSGVLYFNAGEYEKTISIMTGLVNQNLLLEEHFVNLSEIVTVSKNRISHYPSRVVQEMHALALQAEEEKHPELWTKILNILRDNPYALPPDKSTELRIRCLKKLNRDKEAELFDDK